MTGPVPATTPPRAIGAVTVTASVIGLVALGFGLFALIRSDGHSVAVVVLAAALLVGALLVLTSQHLPGPVAAFLAIAAIWTSVLLGLIFFVGGRAVPCPELGTVGQPGRDDAAIARMCEQRESALHPPDLIAANEPGSWLVVWGIGLAVTGGAIAVASRRPRA
jgi:hypothetical protein